jgi:hypothetical protein
MAWSSSPTTKVEPVAQQVPEALLVVLQQTGVVQPQLVRAQQQLCEVDQAGATGGDLIGLVDADEGVGGRVAADDVLGPLSFVLRGIDEPRRLARGPALLVEAHVVDDALQQTDLVVRVQHLEGFGQARFVPVQAQQAVGDTVEGADPHAASALSTELADAMTHLARGLVGESHRQHAVGRHAQHLGQPADAVHQHPRLAGAGAGQHQGVLGISGDGLALGRVERIEQVGNIHAAL